MSRTFSGAANNYLSYIGSMSITAAPVTLLAWVKLTATTSGMVCAYENTSSHYVGLNNLAGNIRALVQQEYGGNSATSAAASVDTWYPIIATYTAGTIAQIHALGESVDGGFCGTFQTEASPGFSIGSLINNAGLAPITGKVAHVAMWSTALDSTARSALIAGADPSTIASGSLIEYWALTGASLVGVNGRTLSVTGTVTSDTGDNPSVGVSAPVLSAGASSNVTQTTATVGATTDQNTGTLYLTLTTTAADRDAVTATQVTDGQQDSGAAAQFATSGAITTTSPSIPLTGLTPGTTYYWDIAQENGNGISNLQSGSFTTAAASRTVTVTIRSRATGTLLNAQARRFWTRLTLSGAAVDGSTDGLNVTCNASGAFVLTGLTIAAGAGYVTYHDPADSTKSINIPVTFLAGT